MRGTWGKSIRKALPGSAERTMGTSSVSVDVPGSSAAIIVISMKSFKTHLDDWRSVSCF